MRALVTGGAGFIGSHLVDRLVARGDEVVVVDDLSSGVIGFIQDHIDSGNIIFHQVDITDIESLKPTMTGVDMVFHLAANPDIRLGTRVTDTDLRQGTIATYNLLEIPAIRKPEVRLYATGIIRISRHPQAIGQILWCFSHGLWIGSSFMLVTCLGLIFHHLFAVWHGDRRLKAKFGDGFEELRRTTSVFPFLAVIDGRQKLQWNEFLRPSQLGICIAVGVFWWSHRFISDASEAFLSFHLPELLR